MTLSSQKSKDVKISRAFNHFDILIIFDILTIFEISNGHLEKVGEVFKNSDIVFEIFDKNHSEQNLLNLCV